MQISIAKAEPLVGMDTAWVIVGAKQVLDLNTEDAVTNASVDCLYCLAQSVGLPNLLSNLQFASPSTHALIPNLFLESAKTLFAWVKLPSQGPPQNTRT